MKAAAPDKKKARAAKDADVSAAKGSSTIFVKNLAWAVGEDELYEFFSSAGDIVDARIGQPPALRFLLTLLCQGSSCCILAEALFLLFRSPEQKSV